MTDAPRLPETLPAFDVASLGDGPDNVIEGVFPDRRYVTVNRPELHSLRTENARAMALVLVGGGYTQLFFDKEGAEVAP